jgi:hypothetical protein
MAQAGNPIEAAGPASVRPPMELKRDSNPIRWSAELRRYHDQLTVLVQLLCAEQLRHASACSQSTVS